jgi:hypothetical protein
METKSKFEAKPGSFNLFKNKEKKEDKHPDYKGEGKDLNGNVISVGAWINEGKSGKYMKCTIELKDEKYKTKPNQTDDLNDSLSDVPF